MWYEKNRANVVLIAFWDYPKFALITLTLNKHENY